MGGEGGGEAGGVTCRDGVALPWALRPTPPAVAAAATATLALERDVLLDATPVRLVDAVTIEHRGKEGGITVVDPHESQQSSMQFFLLRPSYAFFPVLRTEQ
jgi:hypothetical protein